VVVAFEGAVRTAASASLAFVCGYLVALAVARNGADSLGKRLNRTRPSLDRTVALIEPRLGWYQEWYFRLRLDDTLRLAERHGAGLGLLRIKFAVQWDELNANLDQFTEEMRDILARCLRQTDLPGTLGLLDYAVLLPFEDADGVQRAAARLAPEFARLGGRVGYALYPDDAADAESLLEVAARLRVLPMLSAA
jgi:hypothetical protein